MLSCVVFNVRLDDACTGFGFVGWGAVEVSDFYKEERRAWWVVLIIALCGFVYFSVELIERMAS